MTSLLSDVRIGSQLPRIEHFPVYATSAADDAVDIAAVAGLELDPWQEHVLRGSLGERVDGRWSAFRACLVVPRQNGKNAILEARELAGLFLFGERLIIHTAHEFSTARESMLSLITRIRGSELVEHVAGFDMGAFEEDEDARLSGLKTGNTAPSITLKPRQGERAGNRLVYKARSKGGGRGFTGDLVVFDEAYALTLEQMAALLPTMAARSKLGNPQLWFTSSAGMRGSTFLASLRKQGLSKSGERLAYYEWSTDPKRASDDVDGWYEANPGLGVRISEEYVRDEYDSLAKETGTDEQFRRERLGIWDDTVDGSGVIDMDAWDDREGELVEPSGAVVLGIDTSLDRQLTAVVAVGAGDDGVPQAKVVKSSPSTRWLPALIVKVCREHPDVSTIVVDDKGSSAPLVPAIEDALDAAGLSVEIVTTNYPDLAEACANTFDLIHEGAMRHAGDAALAAAVRSAEKRQTEGAFVWSRRKGGAAVVPLIAMSLALWQWVRDDTSYDVMDSIG